MLLMHIEATLRLQVTANERAIEGRTVELQLGIDGVPIFKGSNLNVWPIFGE